MTNAHDMTEFSAIELHCHTALSACAENVLSPAQVLETARRRGVAMVAVTDHNASAHAALAWRLAGRNGTPVVLPGIEITTREEVHLLGLFPNDGPLADLQELLDAHLPQAENDTELFGPQVLYDEADEIVGLDERLRQTAVGLGFDQLLVEIHQRGGLAVPAHVFRTRNSLASQLGFIDETADVDALEVRRRIWKREGYQWGCYLHGFPVLTGSDAHFLEDVGKNALNAPISASFEGLRTALQSSVS